MVCSAVLLGHADFRPLPAKWEPRLLAIKQNFLLEYLPGEPKRPIGFVHLQVSTYTRRSTIMNTRQGQAEKQALATLPLHHPTSTHSAHLDFESLKCVSPGLHGVCAPGRQECAAPADHERPDGALHLVPGPLLLHAAHSAAAGTVAGAGRTVRHTRFSDTLAILAMTQVDHKLYACVTIPPLRP